LRSCVENIVEALLLTIRLVLSLIFGIAGIAKLADRVGSEKAIVDFGLPENTAKPLAVLLPLMEIAAAVLLLFVEMAWVGAVLALGLLLIFIGGITYNMARGNAPDCHCFGQIHSEPVGWSVLIRNLILAALAGLVVFAGRENAGLSAFAWLGDLTTGERMQLGVGLIISSLLAVIVFNLRKIQQNQIVLQRQIETLELAANENGRREVERKDVNAPAKGLPAGAIAPDFAVMDLLSKQVTLEHLLMRGKPILIFFVSPSCNPCKALLPTIEAVQSELGKGLTVVLMSSGNKKENVEKFDRVNDGKIILLQKDREIAALFRSDWTPGAVLVNADGTIGSMLATGDKEIHDLIEAIKPNLITAVNSANGSGYHAPKFLVLPPKKLETSAPRAGQFAPNFTLPNLEGKPISLADYRGMKTLLLFWRATCPFCRGMSEDLQAWEASQNEFNLLIVANNEPEIEAARDFKSTVLVETDLEIQKMLDFDGTPTGILIDEEGRIISDFAQGANDVFALVGYQPKSK
jgi:thiol-disulfide isomerase/thioredoxin